MCIVFRVAKELGGARFILRPWVVRAAGGSSCSPRDRGRNRTICNSRGKTSRGNFLIFCFVLIRCLYLFIYYIYNVCICKCCYKVLNGVDNIEFYCGGTKEILTAFADDSNSDDNPNSPNNPNQPDLVIVNPPRAGLRGTGQVQYPS